MVGSGNYIYCYPRQHTIDDSSSPQFHQCPRARRMIDSGIFESEMTEYTTAVIVTLHQWWAYFEIFDKILFMPLFFASYIYLLGPSTIKNE